MQTLLIVIAAWTQLTELELKFSNAIHDKNYPAITQMLVKGLPPTANVYNLAVEDPYVFELTLIRHPEFTKLSFKGYMPASLILGQVLFPGRGRSISEVERGKVFIRLCRAFALAGGDLLREATEDYEPIGVTKGRTLASFVRNWAPEQEVEFHALVELSKRRKKS